MHESSGRNYNPSSLLISNSTRSLNINPSKLTRTLQPDNSAKKLKINHTNGIKPTTDGNSTVRSLFENKKTSISSFILIRFEKRYIFKMSFTTNLTNI
jgi:hypothetical protein